MTVEPGLLWAWPGEGLWVALRRFLYCLVVRVIEQVRHLYRHTPVFPTIKGGKMIILLLLCAHSVFEISFVLQ